MVTTRAQTRRGRSSSSDSDSSDDVQQVSSDEEPRKTTPKRNSGEAKTNDTSASSSNANASTSSNGVRRSPGERGGASTSVVSAEGERLGRGCRVSRSSVTLDEQYLAASLYRSTAQHRGLPSPSRHGSSTHEEAFAINRRYPMREAAKRAIESLHVTLTSANGAAALGDAEGSDNSNSNSMGTFHFRNHPELEEEIKKKREKTKKKHLQRRGRGRPRKNHDESSVDSDEDDGAESSGSDTSSSSSSSTSSSSLSEIALGSPANAVGEEASHTSANAAAYSRAAPPRRTSNGCSSHNHNHDDAVSLDSSITDASMREESVERAAMQDRHADEARSSSSSSSANDDGTRDFATDAERRRAVRNARESTSQNVNINYYMPDAVGVADARKLRRRQLDRRYRWLVHQEEDARARGDGSGVGSASGGGGSAASGDGGSAVTTANGALGDILPLRIDDDITFDSVGGLPEHIVTLREMVLLPLLYPDLFERLDLKAPRGVLFVGPPGTGKTLMARALANEGSRFACGGSGAAASSSSPGKKPSQPQRIAFFVRKGADMLSKWVGESERQLKLLFEEAKRLQPSIIFFDEVDGLAPTRHAKTEQTQAALVSTLLALLDGLEDRGQVVVIGATNRPDTLDPALRRPGRFDRELVFPLPDAAARRHILTIQLAKKAMPDSAEQRATLLNDLVEMTEGYSGADLGALCTEASLHRLRTALPQLYLSSTRLIVPREVEQARLHVRTEDFYAAAQLMQPSLRRCRSARQVDTCFLDAYVEVLVRGTRDATLAALAPSWSLVDKILRAGSRDCRDMATAVRALSAVPIPQPPRPCLLVLREAAPLDGGGGGDAAAASDQQQQQQRRALQLHHLSISLLKGLPGLHQITVSLPELVWEGDGTMRGGAATAASFWLTRGSAGDYGGVADDYLGGSIGLGSGGGGGGSSGGDAFTHMSQVVQSVRQCSPCVVYLGGAEEWLSDVHGDSDEDEGNEDENTESAERRDGFVRGEGSAEHGATTTAVHASRRQLRRVQLFRFYMNMVADTEVIFLLPCATATTCAMLLGPDPCPSSTFHGGNFPETPASLLGQSVSSSQLHSITSLSPSSPMLMADPPTAVHLTRVPPRHQLLHPQFSIVHAAIAATPLPADLRRFAEYVHRIVTMTLLLHRGGGERDSAAGSRPHHDEDEEETGAAVLREDRAPLPSPLAAAQLRARRSADRARRCEVWRKVEYRRLQLRHVLMKWVSQYINSGKFKLLAHADLDFAPDDPLFKAWRQHTKRHRIGLQDILEKVEDERYVCLSQYHDDVDQLVRNVRSFFRTRAAQDQRYRLKALDLKETCLLNMYKMNREVIRFCEQTRELQEPSSSSSEDEGEDGNVSGRRGKAGRGMRNSNSREEDHDGEARRNTSLVQKEEDPALMAELSRRAVSFSQRPPAPSRKRRRSGWMYGDHKRKRKRTVVAKKTPTVAQVEEEKLENENLGDNGDAHGGDAAMREAEAMAVDVHSLIGFDSTDEEVDDGEKAGEDAKTVEVGEEQRKEVDDSVEGWACALLSTFTYPRLYHVFKSVMRGLEVEVRSLEDRAAHEARQQQEQQRNGGYTSSSAPMSSTAEDVQEAEESHRSSSAQRTSTQTPHESYVTSVFKKLLLAAVAE